VLDDLTAIVLDAAGTGPVLVALDDTHRANRFASVNSARPRRYLGVAGSMTLRISMRIGKSPDVESAS
jgi:hypothetical protein